VGPGGGRGWAGRLLPWRGWLGDGGRGAARRGWVAEGHSWAPSSAGGPRVPAYEVSLYPPHRVDASGVDLEGKFNESKG
jgi:hypothetical protein